MHILLCESDPILSKAIEYRLHKDKYSITCCPNAATALDILKKTNIDVIITDILLDGINGIEFIRQVKTTFGKKIKYLILTQISSPDTIKQAYESGVDEYITKPFDPDKLSMHIKYLLTK